MESRCLRLWLDSKGIFPAAARRTRSAEPVPTTSQARQQQSLDDQPFEHHTLSKQTSAGVSSAPDTVLYLGYGSNLSAETFRGKRNIKPISQVNVVVPALSLTFDLPGIPYSEPCFGNVRYRDSAAVEPAAGVFTTEDYHKNRWQKGLVGVVYEVTKEDYIHIIATEGGGSGYQDVLVDCFPLSGDPMEDVPVQPTGQSFKAHTLFASEKDKTTRPDQSYAQPSPRYLKLITDGAAEHGLPLEYQAFLHQIRTFHLTNNKQRLGSFVFLAIWSPFFLFFIGGASLFLKPDGTYPRWFATFLRAMFTACWASYDHFFRKTFGDGERTIGDEEDEIYEYEVNEKVPLIEQQQCKYGVVEVVVQEV